MIETLANWLRKSDALGNPAQSGCKAYGKCCELFGGHLNAFRADLERWRSLGREDLLVRFNRLGWTWVDPQSIGRLDRRPFHYRSESGGSRCAIHEVKPDMCRAYPTLPHSHLCVGCGHFIGPHLFLAMGFLIDELGDMSLLQSIQSLMFPLLQA